MALLGSKGCKISLGEAARQDRHRGVETVRQSPKVWKGGEEGGSYSNPNTAVHGQKARS